MQESYDAMAAQLTAVGENGSGSMQLRLAYLILLSSGMWYHDISSS